MAQTIPAHKKEMKNTLNKNNMAEEIKTLTKDTVLSACSISKYNWDVVMYGEPYQVVRIDGYVHTIGGRWGNNDLYAYPLSEEMSVDNLMNFEGSPCCWALAVHSENKFKSKWYGESIENRNYVVVTRNGEEFVSMGCRDQFYGIAKAQFFIEQFKEHPLSLNERDWDTKEVGRKIWYGETPAIITRVRGGEIMISPDPDHTDKFPCPPFYTEDFEKEHWDNELSQGLWVSLLDDRLYWFRNEE